jgi:hypothetical protein
VLYPGVGHTGSEPFDDEHGWYRMYRGLSGGVRYKSRLKGWTPFSHSIFPSALKESVITMLLCQQELNETSCDNRSVTTVAAPIKKVTPHIVYNILEYMHWDWFQECQKPNPNEILWGTRKIASRAIPDSMQFLLEYLQNANNVDEDDEDDDGDDNDNDDDDVYYNQDVMVDEDYDDADDDEDEDYEDDEDDEENFHDTIDQAQTTNSDDDSDNSES